MSVHPFAIRPHNPEQRAIAAKYQLDTLSVFRWFIIYSARDKLHLRSMLARDPEQTANRRFSGTELESLGAQALDVHHASLAARMTDSTSPNPIIRQIDT